MKKKLSAGIAFMILIAACNHKKPADSTAVIGFDSTAAYNSSMQSDTANYISVNGVTYRKVEYDPSSNKNTPANTAVKPVVSSNTDTKTTANNTSASNTNNSTTTTATTKSTKKKKGWSKAAKGTVIGAGTGALAGALISKKKGKGALIGAVIGAGGGYIIGRQKDKKDGRN